MLCFAKSQFLYLYVGNDNAYRVSLKFSELMYVECLAQRLTQRKSYYAEEYRVCRHCFNESVPISHTYTFICAFLYVHIHSFIQSVSP